MCLGTGQDAIHIDVKGHFDLRDTTWCRWDTIKVKLTMKVVILGHCTLSLEDLNENSRLIVCVGSKCLSLLCLVKGTQGQLTG